MQTLSGQMTNRSLTAKPLSDKLLGDLLWAAYGVNRPSGERTILTAQNRQDLETHVLRSGGTRPYDALKHSLEQVSSSDLRNLLAGQGFAREAPVGLIHATDTQKNSKELFTAMHAGSAYQNVGLFYASVELHNIVRASYDAEGFASALGLPSSKRILIPQSTGWGEWKEASHNERQRKEPERNTVQAPFLKIRRFPPEGAPSARSPRQSKILGR